jgi:hypothetical protein
MIGELRGGLGLPNAGFGLRESVITYERRKKAKIAWNFRVFTGLLQLERRLLRSKFIFPISKADGLTLG